MIQDVMVDDGASTRSARCISVRRDMAQPLGKFADDFCRKSRDRCRSYVGGQQQQSQRDAGYLNQRGSPFGISPDMFAFAEQACKEALCQDDMMRDASDQFFVENVPPIKVFQLDPLSNCERCQFHLQGSALGGGDERYAMRCMACVSEQGSVSGKSRRLAAQPSSSVYQVRALGRPFVSLRQCEDVIIEMPATYICIPPHPSEEGIRAIVLGEDMIEGGRKSPGTFWEWKQCHGEVSNRGTIELIVSQAQFATKHDEPSEVTTVTKADFYYRPKGGFAACLTLLYAQYAVQPLYYAKAQAMGQQQRAIPSAPKAILVSKAISSASKAIPTQQTQANGISQPACANQSTAKSAEACDRIPSQALDRVCAQYASDRQEIAQRFAAAQGDVGYVGQQLLRAMDEILAQLRRIY